jgi:hypothetical protein
MKTGTMFAIAIASVIVGVFLMYFGVSYFLPSDACVKENGLISSTQKCCKGLAPVTAFVDQKATGEVVSSDQKFCYKE